MAGIALALIACGGDKATAPTLASPVGRWVGVGEAPPRTVTADVHAARQTAPDSVRLGGTATISGVATTFAIESAESSYARVPGDDRGVWRMKLIGSNTENIAFFLMCEVDPADVRACVGFFYRNNVPIRVTLRRGG